MQQTSDFTRKTDAEKAKQGSEELYHFRMETHPWWVTMHKRTFIFYCIVYSRGNVNVMEKMEAKMKRFRKAASWHALHFTISLSKEKERTCEKKLAVYSDFTLFFQFVIELLLFAYAATSTWIFVQGVCTCIICISKWKTYKNEKIANEHNIYIRAFEHQEATTFT